MPGSSPALLARLFALLEREDHAVPATRIVREVLGIETGALALADEMVRALVDGDVRVRLTGEGWERVPDAADPSPRLDGAFAVLFAPRGVAVAASLPADGRPAPICASLEGEEEMARARALGVPVSGHPVGLLAAARLLRGYRGPPEPVALAQALGAGMVEDTADDAEAMARVVAAAYQGLVQGLDLEGIHTVDGLVATLAAARGEASLEGRAFDEGTLSALDEGPGAYVFRNASGAPLYVGQSMNVGARVRSYFVGPPRDQKDAAIRDEAWRLEVEPCDSGPDALIREAALIARLRPRLNTQRSTVRPASESGVLLARDPRRDDRWVLFALEGARLVARGVAFGAGNRARASVERVLTRWRSARGARHGGAAGDERAARLIAIWRGVRPGDPFLERGLHGDDGAIRDAILALLREGAAG